MLESSYQGDGQGVGGSSSQYLQLVRICLDTLGKVFMNFSGEMRIDSNSSF